MNQEQEVSTMVNTHELGFTRGSLIHTLATVDLSEVLKVGALQEVEVGHGLIRRFMGDLPLNEIQSFFSQLYKKCVCVRN